MNLPQHTRRILLLWVVLTAIAVPLIVLFLGPHLPPGRMTAEAASQVDANTLMTALIAPIVLLLAVYFGYSLLVFRARSGAVEDGPPIFGHAQTQMLWIVFTSVVVIALAAWGSYTLLVSAHGAGGGQGPSPIARPSGWQHSLQVQVIGQQWNWTYRFPGYGDVETQRLELPAGAMVELHVTSLDVTHSFWAYQLGVKADAVPGVDNIAFVHPRKIGRFTIRCAELCGLWHGHMFQTGHVVSRSTFDAWIAAQRKANMLNEQYLPGYSGHYYPQPLRRAG